MNHEEKINDLNRRILRLEVLVSLFLDKFDEVIGGSEVWAILQTLKQDIANYED